MKQDVMPMNKPFKNPIGCMQKPIFALCLITWLAGVPNICYVGNYIYAHSYGNKKQLRRALRTISYAWKCN